MINGSKKNQFIGVKKVVEPKEIDNCKKVKSTNIKESLPKLDKDTIIENLSKGNYNQLKIELYEYDISQKLDILLVGDNSPLTWAMCKGNFGALRFFLKFSPKKIYVTNYLIIISNL